MKRLLLFVAVGMLSVSSLLAQYTVSGTVTDGSSGDALVGVTVLIKGTTAGAISDENGRYSVEVASRSDSLQFSYLGFETLVEGINGRSTVNVGMTSSSVALDEVVITALGIETLSDNYGKFTIEPFERGFGTTVGNSLRRLLLSSLEGATITGV